MLRHKILVVVMLAAGTIVSSCSFFRASDSGAEKLVLIDEHEEIPADSVSVEVSDSNILSEVTDTMVNPLRKAAFIVVDKANMTLSVCDFRSDTLLCVPMCCGRQLGDKQTVSDDRTPEGVFKIRRIENSTEWPHYLPDGSAEYGSYGPYFIRLDYPPMYRIGIHGTKHPESMGKRASEGCVRVTNENILRIVHYAYRGMPVIITSSPEDIAENAAFMLKHKTE